MSSPSKSVINTTFSWGSCGAASVPRRTTPNLAPKKSTIVRFSRWKDSPESIEIMFYFKNAGISPSELDPEQIAKVQAFKKRISSEGIYGEFQDAEEFRTKARMHLTGVIQDWRKRAPSDPETEKTTPTPTAPAAASESAGTPAASESAGTLTNLLEVSEDGDDDGIFELAERATDAMEVMGDVAEKITGTITYLGTRTTEPR